MDSGDVVGLVAIITLFIALPWVILHYVTRWKTAATLTQGDEALLDELYRLARRLDERMNTVERLVAADHPDFKPHDIRFGGRPANDPLAELDPQTSTRGAIR